MVCPECLAAYGFYNKAKSVTNIFTQILHLDDYILSEDWYHQGYAIGKITHELEGLSSIFLEIDELVEKSKEQMDSSFLGESYKNNENIILDEYK
jgi:hypothetical protein